MTYVSLRTSHSNSLMRLGFCSPTCSRSYSTSHKYWRNSLSLVFTYAFAFDGLCLPWNKFLTPRLCAAKNLLLLGWVKFWFFLELPPLNLLYLSLNSCKTTMKVFICFSILSILSCIALSQASFAISRTVTDLFTRPRPLSIVTSNVHVFFLIHVSSFFDLLWYKQLFVLSPQTTPKCWCRYLVEKCCN